MQQQKQYLPHEWDEGGVCIHCGFDGAEHWHWANSTYEGRAASPEQRKMPICRDWNTGLPRRIA